MPAGGGQRHGVHEERGAQRDVGQRPTDRRPGDGADQEPRLPQAGGPAALVGVDHAQQQRDGGHREHRRPDAADPAQHEQLGVGLRQPGQRAAHRDDPDAEGEDQPLADPVDQPAAAEGGDQPHEREGGDDCSGRRAADPELAGVDGDRRRHDPEPDRDRERDRSEHRDLARQPGERVPPARHERDGNRWAGGPGRAVAPIERRTIHSGRPSRPERPGGPT